VNNNRGRTQGQGLPKISRAPTYTACRAVIFAIVQLSSLATVHYDGVLFPNLNSSAQSNLYVYEKKLLPLTADINTLVLNASPLYSVLLLSKPLI